MGGSTKLLPAERLLHSLHNLIQLVRIYHGKNQLIDNGLRQLVKSAAELMRLTDILSVHMENGRFYINDEKLLRRRGSVAVVLNNLFEFLACRRIFALDFQTGLLSAPPDQVVTFCGLLNECAVHGDQSEWLPQSLRESGIDWVEISQGEVTVETGEEGDNADNVEQPGYRSPRKVYSYTLRSLQDVAQKISINQRVGLRKAVRMVQAMVEEVLYQEEPLMLAMSTIRAYDDYTFTHSVNVSILSLYIGKQLGLPRETMEYLGVSGLFHDLGKVMVPAEILNKSESLNDADILQIRQHSLNSAKLIVQLVSAPVYRKARIMLPPFEHHLKYDLSGYPSVGWRRPISLCGRILAIADVYDALTSPRVYRKEAMSADRALGLMMQGAGTVFDPILLKVFVRMLGVYPIGTLLELDSGELALVSRPPATEDLQYPWAIILQEDGQGGYVAGAEVDLAEKTAAGDYLRKIVSSAHPSTKKIQPSHYLV